MEREGTKCNLVRAGGNSITEGGGSALSWCVASFHFAVDNVFGR